MSSKKIYCLGSRTELRNLTDILSGSFFVKTERTKTRLKRFYDTFDWRLFSSGYYLTSEKDNFSLFQITSENPETILNCKTEIRPLKWDCFPEGEFRTKIYKFISIRALIPSPEFKVSSQVIRLLNEDQKIIVRLIIDTVTVTNSSGNKKLLKLFKIDPVRGYSRESKKVINVCRKLNFTEEKRNSFILINGLLGREPGSYNAKFTQKLSPDMKSRDAIKQIIYHALHTASLNEQGIIDDIDNEFLHDFRVSARKARSIAAQFKSVFDESTAAALKHDLSYFGKISNSLRDLDVYLLEKNRLRRLLPVDLSGHLDYLFEIMQKQRAEELKKIRNTLKSKQYSSLMNRWKIYASPDADNPGEPAKFSATGIKKLAGKIIISDYKRLTRLGRSINQTTPDEEIHKLRIECKKLRYLLETFVSLFPYKKISELISRLKILQDYLGNFNDVSMQQERMKQYMEVLERRDTRNKMVFAAIGGIITHLYFEQLTAREAFNNTFREFDTKQNAKLINDLIS